MNSSLLKKCGIVGIDRSGSRGDFPLAIASVYSNKVGNFENVVREVREELEIRHGYIKGKDFKPNQYEIVLENLKKNNIKFFALIVESQDYQGIESKIRWRKGWEETLEAWLWSVSVKKLIKLTGILPSEIFYEMTYHGSGIFDSRIRTLVSKTGVNKNNILIGSKTSSYIMAVDWVARFFHKSRSICNNYPNNNKPCTMKKFENNIKEII